jgi:hypothetical protein
VPVIREVRRSVIGFTTVGVPQLVRPAQLAPWFRFGDAIQEGKATLQNGTNRIDSQAGDVAQPPVTDVGIRAMLSLSIGGIRVCRKALRHQAREYAGSAQDHEQDQRNHEAECQAYNSRYEDVADNQDNQSRDDASAQGICTLVMFDAG